MSEATKRQVLEMCVGIVIHNLILTVGSLIWFREPSVFLGIFAGALAAVAMLVSMAHSTELCVDLADAEAARKKMAAHSVLRSVALLAAIGVLWKFTGFNPLAFILGTLGLKTGAYLYPVIHKFFKERR